MMTANNKNYFLSGWIANLGVVPLLRSFVLRTLPLAFFLLARLVSVSFVLDAMIYLLKMFKRFKPISFGYVPILSLLVKIISSFSLICFFLNPCCEASVKKKADIASDSLLLSLGEIKEYALDKAPSEAPKNQNPDILQVKWTQGSDTLQLKAKKRGQVLVEVANLQIHITIVAKNRYQNLQNACEYLQSLGLDCQFDGSLVSLRGEFSRLEDLKSFQDWEKHKSPGLLLRKDIKIQGRFKKQILNEIKNLLENNLIDQVNCDWKQNSLLSLVCSYNASTPIPEETKKQMEEFYGIHFFPSRNPAEKLNYHLSFKVLQLEKEDGSEFSLGLDQLSFTWEDLFQEGASAMISKNQVILQKEKLNVSTLAEPEIITAIGKKSGIEVGSYRPLALNKTHEGSTRKEFIEWNFAGLKVKFSLLPLGDHFAIDYELELTQASEGDSVSGSKEQGQMHLKLNTVFKLFEVGLKAQGEQTHSLPILSDIPWIGGLFTSTSKRTAYKKIYGLVQFEKNQEETNYAIPNTNTDSKPKAL